jgi:hypothetical protein
MRKNPLNWANLKYLNRTFVMDRTTKPSIFRIFVVTVLATLPARSAYQGESFAFIGVSIRWVY